MAQSDFTQGLAVGVPANVPVAHKFDEREIVGSSVDQIHDCGIVYISGASVLVMRYDAGRQYRQANNRHTANFLRGL